MPWVGFEPTISVGERPKTYALDRAATGTGKERELLTVNFMLILILCLNVTYLLHRNHKSVTVHNKHSKIPHRQPQFTLQLVSRRSRVVRLS